jgi:hypothetical protein
MGKYILPNTERIETTRARFVDELLLGARDVQHLGRDSRFYEVRQNEHPVGHQNSGSLWNRKRTVKAVLTRSGYLEFGQALVAETVTDVGEEELAF